ncbi:hypothetical protein K1T71_013675 [Dendrolimus kikuchii]|uniref:Uncharacterized protein n=1 Tax=Dendrolimus kikuchii TaxID=765133 RepID=A0ACC1CH33_9NEOP|nr:hypothetical protein K1T71_013675 [Dendrolimus kikuchii]
MEESILFHTTGRTNLNKVTGFKIKSGYTMAKLSLLVVLLCQIITLPILGGRSDDENPFMDMASALLQNMGGAGNNNMDGLAAIGNIVGSLMQGDNAKNLGSMLGQNGDSNAGDILSGLGSLLGGQDGKMNPALIGTMVSLFAQQMGSSNTPKRQKRQSQEEPGLNLDSIMGLASGLLGNQNSNSGGNVGNYLPLIMNAISSLSNNEAEKKADEHKDHASFLPPFLEKAHLYWDLFINSELGKYVWEKTGMKQTLKAFTGPDGKISFDMMFKNLENHSFRRHWIKTAAKYLTDFVVKFSKPEVYQSYITTSQYVVNGFIDTQGFPKSTHFNVNKPEKSITALLNYVLKKYLDIDTDVYEYVKPAVEYIKDTLKMAQKTTKSLSSRSDYNALADRLTDTLNLEVIEPVLRVHRAYKHSLAAPHCQEHLMCLVNQHPDQGKPGLSGFKTGLTKLSSIAASAALSFQNGKGFWDLYNAVQSDVNCEAVYPADCSAFHEHEQKVTTEVYHNEL